MKKWFMPAEWTMHSACWMAWPYSRTNWKNSAKPAQIAYSRVAEAISLFEMVNIITHPSELQHVRFFFSSQNIDINNINIIEMEYADAWMRDIGPTFVLLSTNSSASDLSIDDFSKNNSQTSSYSNVSLGGISWKFNAWGGLYKKFESDDAVAKNVMECVNLPTENQIFADFVLEGGSIHVDGEGTILVTEECLLNTNRNPLMTKQDIETRLLSFLGGLKVIWLPRGLVADEDTNGHIDNICCFTKPGEVLLSWCDDPIDEQYLICREAEAILNTERDAKNRVINVVKLPIPPPMYYTEDDCESLIVDNEDSSNRKPGSRLAASYVNFYIANGAIIAPSFDVPTDKIAYDILSNTFPNHKIIQIPTRDILLGGGNIHCITQQQPLSNLIALLTLPEQIYRTHARKLM
eukprot:gene16352-22283_t